MTSSPIRVLYSFPRPRKTTNPFISQLVESLPDAVVPVFFSWRAALCGKYDVVHLHWPENLLRGRTQLRTLAFRSLFVAFMARTAIQRIPIVRTLHNVEPHERVAPVDAVLLRWCDRRTTSWIRLNEHSPTPAGALTATIRHGHYRDWFAAHTVPATIAGRMLFFGLIRPYKGVDRLIAAFRDVADPDVSLQILGNPKTAQLREVVESACVSDVRITATLDYVDDAALAAGVGQSELVVLPYREMHNSGAALLALSLNRPVLLPAGEVANDLADEVGPGWVFSYHGELDAGALERTLAALRGSARAPQPDLSEREWAPSGHRHADVYRQALARTRERR